MFLRLIFVSLQDVQKLAKIDSISKDTSYWPTLMFVQCSTQLFAVAVVFYSVVLIGRAEREIAEEPESKKLGPASSSEMTTAHGGKFE